ncbi:rhomboid-related protein 2-like [Fopius arisanus]|uniref:Rhomboid-related protein 2-like n=1 Tax=Fopius arisanus TaxID=64838 RepID=A0A9R1UAX1_9HYME|nr:PREDICTED: rhomboid-related protein 2-like [Fopius arisanus]
MASQRNRQESVNISVQFDDHLHWKGIFDKYDLDGDGKISYNELKEMLKESSYENDIPPSVVKMILQKADPDRSGYLVYPEFLAMIQRKDMQGFFGRLISGYVYTLVPERPIPSDPYSPRTSVAASEGRYEKEYNCRPPAIGMLIISIMEIVLFLYDIVLAPTKKPSSFQGPAAQLLIYNPQRRYEAWRYVTYMFVHAGVIHLVSNLVVQILWGIPLEMVHKWWRVLTVYLAGVLAGSIGFSVANPKLFLAGASGGVYALMTAHIATIIMNWQQMKFAVLQLCVFGFITILDVGLNFYNRYVLNKQDGVGYDAHLAGAAAGLLVGINVLRNLKVKKWEKVVWWLSILTYTALMVAGILWNIFCINVPFT